MWQSVGWSSLTRYAPGRGKLFCISNCVWHSGKAHKDLTIPCDYCCTPSQTHMKLTLMVKLYILVFSLAVIDSVGSICKCRVNLGVNHAYTYEQSGNEASCTYELVDAIKV